jgi:hypothetical protein
MYRHKRRTQSPASLSGKATMLIEGEAVEVGIQGRRSKSERESSIQTGPTSWDRHHRTDISGPTSRDGRRREDGSKGQGRQ